MARDPSAADDLRRFEISLLVERSVTTAARRIGAGQPAMSRAFARLRAMFDDPMLIRTPAGMEPTARALALVGPVASLLAGLRSDIFGGRTFDPATAQRSFRIGVSDQAEAAPMQDVLRAIARGAPTVRLIARSVEMACASDLLVRGIVERVGSSRARVV